VTGPTTTPRGKPSRSAVAAAALAVALGTFGFVAFAAGNHRWDGVVLFELGVTHGIHASDLFGLIPFAAGVLLARWCLRHDR
jgi:hypothetical protein